MATSSDLVKSNAAVLILSCLAREPMHGYRIVKELDSITDGYFQMREGTLYPHLHQLERDGLIEGYWENVAGGRDRRNYRITERGRAEFARRAEEWRRFQDNTDRVLRLATEGQVG
jgi:PadR family transcriptional regulator, regulatory protein PadR